MMEVKASMLVFLVSTRIRKMLETSKRGRDLYSRHVLIKCIE